jgi:TonB family protein
MTFHETFAEWSRWIWPLLANHLWQTTLFVLVAWGGVLLLGRVTARVRYFIWMIALVKFLLPSALLISAIERVGFDLSRAPATEVFSNIAQPVPPIVIDQEAIPSAEPVIIAARSSPQGHDELYCALTLLWGLAATALLVRWLVRRRQFKRALRIGAEVREGREAEAFNQAKSWLLPNREIKLIVVPGLRELGVWRIWRPVVVVPEGLAERLSDQELEAVMMHELIHIVRYDNLRNIWQMLLCCLFWFHPLVWLIDRRLLGEGEVICDEAVVRYSGDARVYAASLWKVAQFGFGWNFAGVSRATGSNLSKRIKLILDTRRRTKLSLIGRTFAGLAVCVLAAFAVTMGLVTRSGMGAAGLQVETRRESQPPVTVPARPTPSDSTPQIPAAATDASAASAQIEPSQSEPPLATVPLHLENESQFPIAAIQASIAISKLVSSETGAHGVIPVDTVKEQTDLTSRLRLLPLSPGHSHIRNLKYSVKIMNKGAQPITRLKLEILHPILLGINGISLRRIWGKVSDGLRTNEVYTFSGIRSVGDRSDDSEVMNNLPYFRLRVADLSYDEDLDDPQTALVNDGLRSLPEFESEEMSPSLKPTILRKEKAAYTPEARAKGVEGTVLLSAVFAADGQLRVLRVIRGLPYGLSNQAVNTAYRMLFHPAMKDGVPVNVRGNIEFDFKLDQ